MTAVVVALVGVLGLAVGSVVNRAAGAFPWPPRGVAAPLPSRLAQCEPVGTVGRVEFGPDRPGVLDVAERPRTGRLAVRRPVLEVATAALFALTALRFGVVWDLPAYLYLAGVGVLLAVIDLRHHLLPNRVVVPSYGIGTALLLVAAASTGEWSALGRAVLGGVVLFAAFLVLALISPAGLGMGDVKLAGLIGLYLGWLGWPTLVVGGAAGFAVQAAVSLVLIAIRRIGWRGELAFGPAMLVGAALVIGVTSEGPLG